MKRRITFLTTAVAVLTVLVIGKPFCNNNPNQSCFSRMDLELYER